MDEFIDAALGFPAGIFTVALAVVVVYWLVVLCGVVEHDAWESDAGSSALGAPGVPLTVSASVLIAVAWFTSLAGTVLADRLGVGGGSTLVLLALALLVARGVTGLLVRPLRRVFQPDDPPPSRQDFIGQIAVVRTGRVDARFGQAEVAAADGSTAVVQVRQTGSDPLTHGSSGLLYAYDERGEFFWVAPFDADLGPRTAG
ncbi:hypothetical protein ACGFYY_12855 [Streptomyces sp. NPDC048331]|uniref:hypothetical protein n=1 Tax=Streptomyces sp. NPDC048331 TaxID=3365534 RepID=UPI0037176333